MVINMVVLNVDVLSTFSFSGVQCDIYRTFLSTYSLVGGSLGLVWSCIFAGSCRIVLVHMMCCRDYLTGTYSASHVLRSIVSCFWRPVILVPQILDLCDPMSISCPRSLRSQRPRIPLVIFCLHLSGMGCHVAMFLDT